MVKKTISFPSTYNVHASTPPPPPSPPPPPQYITKIADIIDQYVTNIGDIIWTKKTLPEQGSRFNTPPQPVPVIVEPRHIWIVSCNLSTASPWIFSADGVRWRNSETHHRGLYESSHVSQWSDTGPGTKQPYRTCGHPTLPQVKVILRSCVFFKMIIK